MKKKREFCKIVAAAGAFRAKALAEEWCILSDLNVGRTQLVEF